MTIEIAKETARIYFDYNCTLQQALEWAKDIYKGEKE